MQCRSIEDSSESSDDQDGKLVISRVIPINTDYPALRETLATARTDPFKG